MVTPSQQNPLISSPAADKLIAYRDQNGGFNSMDEVLQVEGFDETRARQVREGTTL